MNRRIEVQITTPLNPTEVTDRVASAITALFPSASVEEGHGELIATTHSLDRFTERLREQAIVDTAREVFRSNREGNTFSFDLKKQAAHEGVVNFSVGNPDELGDITVRVRVEEPSVDEIIDQITSPTGSEE